MTQIEVWSKIDMIWFEYISIVLYTNGIVYKFKNLDHFLPSFKERVVNEQDKIEL